MSQSFVGSNSDISMVQVGGSNVSAFGDIISNELTPVVQLDFIYGINTQTGASSVATTGVVDTNVNRLRIQTGVGAAGAATFRSVRVARYRAGQGMLSRFTAAWTSAAASSTQVVGVGGAGTGYFFGFNGTAFGVSRRIGGVDNWVAQTSWNGDKCFAAGTMIKTSKGDIPIERVVKGDLVLTRNGYQKVLRSWKSGTKEVITRLGITATPDHPFITTQGIKRLDALVPSDVMYVWNEKQSSIVERNFTDTQILSENILETISGEELQSLREDSTDKFGSTISEKSQRDITSTIEVEVYDLEVENEHEFFANNILVHNCDGTGASGFNWNKTFGNVMMIKYPFLGYGNISFWVQDSTTSSFILCHTIRYTNTSSLVQVDNPSMPFYANVVNAGNTSNLISYIGSVANFICGTREYLGAQWAIDNSKTTTTEQCILNIKNCTTFNAYGNTGLIRLRSLSFAYPNNTTSYAIVRFKKGVTIGGAPSYTPINGSTADNGATITTGNSIASVDTAGTTVTNGTYIYQATCGNNQGSVIDLTPYNFFIAADEILTVSGFASNSSTLSVGLNWNEDV